PIVSIAPWQMPDDHVPFRFQQVGRVDLALDELSKSLKTIDWDRDAVKATRQAALAAVAPGSTDSGLRAHEVVRATAARLAGRARVTVDAGAHMFPATMLWPASEPNELLISNGLGTMGFALPAAIGAALPPSGATTSQRSRVVALTGDGGLLICLGELA